MRTSRGLATAGVGSWRVGSSAAVVGADSRTGRSGCAVD